MAKRQEREGREHRVEERRFGDQHAEAPLLRAGREVRREVERAEIVLQEGAHPPDVPGEVDDDGVRIEQSAQFGDDAEGEGGTERRRLPGGDRQAAARAEPDQRALQEQRAERAEQHAEQRTAVRRDVGPREGEERDEDQHAHCRAERRQRAPPPVIGHRDAERPRGDQVEDDDDHQRHAERPPRGDRPPAADRVQAHLIDLHADDATIAVRQFLGGCAQFDDDAMPARRRAAHVEIHRLPVGANGELLHLDAIDEHRDGLCDAGWPTGAEAHAARALPPAADPLEDHERCRACPAVMGGIIVRDVLGVEVLDEGGLVRAADIDADWPLDLVRGEQGDGTEEEEDEHLPADRSMEPRRCGDYSLPQAVASLLRGGCALCPGQTHGYSSHSSTRWNRAEQRD